MVTFPTPYENCSRFFWAKIPDFFLTMLSQTSCLIWVSFCIKKGLKYSNNSHKLYFCLKVAGNARNKPLRDAGTKREKFEVRLKVIHVLLLSSSNFEIWYQNFKKLTKLPKYHPNIKANKIYVDISKWTTIMSRRHVRHFYAVFWSYFLKSTK